MQPYPRSPDLVWPGHLHGTGCLSARAVGTGFPTVVRCLCLGPVRGWVWVLLTPPVLAGVLGGRVWAQFVVLSLLCRLSVVFAVGVRFRPDFGSSVVAWAPRSPPAVSGSGVRYGRVCWARVSAVPSPSWLGCRGCVFCASVFFFFFLGGGPCPGPSGPRPPIPFLSGWVVGSFFFFLFFFVCYSPPLLAGFRCRGWWAVPATPGWGPLAAVVCGVWFAVCGGGVLVGLWLVCGVVGLSPLLAEVPVCLAPPLLAGFRCRWVWAVPATPAWGPLAAVVCGVWRWCVGGVVAGVWCGWSLPTSQNYPRKCIKLTKNILISSWKPITL